MLQYRSYVDFVQSTAAHTTRLKGVLCAVMLLGSLAHLAFVTLTLTAGVAGDLDWPRCYDCNEELE